MRDIKSRVHGAENLTVLMHQHQLLTFASKFDMFSERPPRDKVSFTVADRYDPEMYSFLSFRNTVSTVRQLTGVELRRLKEHYLTVVEGIESHSGSWADLDPSVQLWYRCRRDKTIFHCAETEQKNSNRLNYLVCLLLEIDKHAHISHQTRPEEMIEKEFYGYIQFFCVHTFHGVSRMLAYIKYHKVNHHHSLVEDCGPWVSGFVDITVLRHLCAVVPGHNKKRYFAEPPEVMERRLRKALCRAD